MTHQQTTSGRIDFTVISGLRFGVTALLACAVLAGCSTTGSQGHGQSPQDPYESFNRSIYSFNEGLDRNVLRPIARGYEQVVPTPARTGVSNFFGNLGDAWSFVNNTLQFKGEAAMSSFFRVAVNSTFGLGGLLDVATEMRLERYKTDFGMTLGHWGVPTGPYLMLPLLGPSTVRDTAALPADYYGNPLTHLSPSSHRYALTGLRIVNTRANLLGTTDLLEEAAVDPYIMMRDFYLAQRVSGEASDGKLDDDYYDEDDGVLPDDSAEIKVPAVPEVKTQ
ncbi:VacJ family lipoprotein [Lampropedia puyangensis]|uniref:VacJ family lipoprotein n=2 Tax=Lampropedia puyangensis TaxID=1330072 RepID=A0A4S8F2M8_9BURK|nr:VacJ family lipoprotein [Lampropedia puyangensis]THU01560.1 VacJ family lipoprotein [Lampropedia puyangensis]